eukprot:scaffold143425_cov14-Tisochrysis_lutea.AAC.1
MKGKAPQTPTSLAGLAWPGQAEQDHAGKKLDLPKRPRQLGPDINLGHHACTLALLGRRSNCWAS